MRRGAGQGGGGQYAVIKIMNFRKTDGSGRGERVGGRAVDNTISSGGVVWNGGREWLGAGSAPFG